MQADLDHLRQLPLAEKLRVVEVLWEDIATSTEDFPFPGWMRTEVEQRLAEHDQRPERSLTRDEVWRRVDDNRG
jgi:putative addiction module component (TIGR02574 family)